MILKQKYNRNDFLKFQEQFLPDFKKDIRPVITKGLLVTKNAYLLGQSDKLDLPIFEFMHTSSSDARVSLASDGFRVLKDSATYRALVVYYSEESDDWRLSLLTATPEINEQGKIKQSFSNPRRYSFFLGPEAKVHTPEEFLLKRGVVKDKEDLIDRFDVEVVTKEFFDRYKMLFDNLQKYLSKDQAFKNFAEKNDINVDSFAKKILGQIVFCYFLQKKGWLGAPKDAHINKGDKDFMRSLFKKSINEDKNFYNGYLEYLFYDVLNKAPDKKGDFYRNYLGCQAPFLNGGLFEPIENYDWKKSFIHIPDTIFSNKQGMGILDVFDLYNFTVYEDDPVDREVSVDPEMLGKVFENLLPENIRKGQGAYYTPREIVHYMCQESLINYLVTETKIEEKKIRKFITSKDHLFTSEGVFTFLPAETEKIDEALANIKVCDPACGSGAFLVGTLHEIVMARRVLNPKKYEYILKKEAIQDSIYGVDIDPGAVEIAKLRLWLSLVVDYALEDIEPLPNLDYKIMCGNSLLEEFEGVRFYDGANDDVTLFKDERKEKIQELKRITKEYFNISDEKMKRVKREEINELKDWFIKATLEKQRKLITAQRKKIEAKANMFEERSRKEFFIEQNEIFLSEAKLIEVLRELHNPQKTRPFFIWKLEFMNIFEEKGGFDVVIANPPYIKEAVNKHAFNGLKSSDCYQGKMDIWYLFGSKGLDILRKQGVMAFIATNNWVTNDGASKFRNKIIKQSRIIDFIDFGDYKVFSAGIQTMVLVLIKDDESSEYISKYGKLLNNKADGNLLASFLRESAELSNSSYEKFKVPIRRVDFLDGYIKFIDLNIGLILDKIKRSGNLNLEDHEIFSGIDVMQDFVNKSHLDNLKKEFKVGDGVFVLSEKEKESVKWNKKELDLIKPYYTTQEIDRYYANKLNTHWVIYAGANTNSKILDYPNIKKHLDDFQNIITSVNKPYGLHRTRVEDNFLGEKIFSIRKCALPSFSYVDFPCYVSRAFMIIKTSRMNLKYLLAILNSKVSAFWLFYKGKLQGSQFQLDKIPLMDIPIPSKNISEQKKIIWIVEEILSLSQDKKINAGKILEYERQIDQIIYKLYGLTDEDIQIIEYSIAKK